MTTTKAKAVATDDQMGDLVKVAAADAEQPDSLPDHADHADQPTAQEFAERIFGPDVVKRPVIAKLARIMADLPTLNPEGYNAFFKYPFVKDTQITGAIRPRLAREGLMIIPDVVDETWIETKTAQGKISWVTKMKVLFTVIDADSGDSVSGHGFGYGDDSGDKGANKAFTAALKYWLMKLFEIGGEDAEADPLADQRAGDRLAGGAARDVSVQQANITGVARGGRSDKATLTQANAIINVVKQLGWDPEALGDFVNGQEGWTKLHVPEEGDPNPTIKAWLGSLSADMAGTIISALMDAKDAAGEENKDDDIPDESGYS